MIQCDLDSSGTEWVIEHPETIKAFEKFGIDYSCEGKSLIYLCQMQGLDAQAVLDALRKCIENKSGEIN